MSEKFLKLGVLGLSLLGLFASFLILIHFQGLNNQNFILSEKLKEADVEYNYDLARLYLNKSDPDPAKVYFVDSLKANPLYTKSFVDLSEIYLDEDSYEQSEILLRRAQYLSPYAFKLIWRMAILSLWIDQKDLAMDLLNTISRVDSGKVFDLAWRIFDDKDQVNDQLVNKNNIKSYFNFLMQKKEVERTYGVWDKLAEYKYIDNDLEIKYMDFLIKNDQFVKAGKLWNEMHGESEDEITLWNGSFETKPIQNGFGWIIEKIDNAYVGYDWDEKTEGNYSLYLEFDGKENLEYYHISKIVPVLSNRDYTFSYNLKTDELSTTNGVYWAISCYPERSLYNIKTTVITGSNSWKEYKENIPVPEECNALRLILRRDKSKKLDKFISGKVWIDDVEMKLVNNEIN